MAPHPRDKGFELIRPAPDRLLELSDPLLGELNRLLLLRPVLLEAPELGERMRKLLLQAPLRLFVTEQFAAQRVVAPEPFEYLVGEARLEPVEIPRRLVEETGRR